MAIRRRGGLDISGANGKRAPKASGTTLGKKRSMFSARSSAQERHALSRAAKGRGSYIHPSGNKPNRRFTRRGVLIAVFVMVGAVALAVAVGAFVYHQIVRNALKPKLDIDPLKAELSAVENKTDPFWCVLVETNSPSAEEGRGEIANLALMYFDPENVTLSTLWIPSDTRVYIDGYGYHKLSDAFSIGEKSGEAQLVAALEKLADVNVTHYLELNDAGLARLEGNLSPLSVDVESADKGALSSAIYKKIFGSSNEQISSMAYAVTDCIATDATTDEVQSIISLMHGINIDEVGYQAEMPCKVQTIDSVQYSVVDSDNWNTLVTRVSNGMSPVAGLDEVNMNSVTRNKITVSVWNGVGVSGVANDCTNELGKLGWNVINTGNAAQFVYEETFVVYKDTDDEAAARLLASDLGQGRVVRSAARYSYDGNLLVVVGKDYKPY